jgi:hypothetical protein
MINRRLEVNKKNQLGPSQFRIKKSHSYRCYNADGGVVEISFMITVGGYSRPAGVIAPSLWPRPREMGNERKLGRFGVSTLSRTVFVGHLFQSCWLKQAEKSKERAAQQR